MEYLIDNAHKSLDFMHEAFQIVEKNMMNFSTDVRESGARAMTQVESLSAQQNQRGQDNPSERKERDEKRQDDKQAGGRANSPKNNR